MKLTKTDREAFVAAVMNDVPYVDYSEQAKTLITEDVLSKMPAKVRAVYDDKKLRHYLKSNHIWFRNGLQGFYLHGAPSEYEVSGDLKKQTDDLAEKHKAQQQARAELQRKVGAMIAGCTTLKQAKERLPEFEKYLPADRDGTGTANLPAVANVVADLTKAGWPKK